MKRLVMAVAVAAALGGCAPTRGRDYESAMAEAHRASSAGRFGEASASYARAAKLGKIERDREHAAYLAALELARSGNVASALRGLDAIADASPPGRLSSSAAYRAAALRRTTGSEAEGLQGMGALLQRFPDSPMALPALTHLVREREAKEGRTGALALLDTLEKTLPRDAAIQQRIAYDKARRAEDDRAARDAFVALADRWPYPKGAYWDDALFRASELEEKLGRPREAVALLERLLSEREISGFLGSYERPRFAPAKLRIARLLAEQLGDKEGARRTYHAFYTEFTTSPLRDDALWQEARLFREDGREGDACSTLATLVSAFPDSRYVPCATEGCPGLARPAKSLAPRGCRPYLKRQGAAAPKEAEATPLSP